MSINANELRIGNWVAIGEMVERPLTKIIPELCGAYNPIPLTPDILEKAGFVKSNTEYGDGIPTLGKFQISLYDGDNFIKMLATVRYDKSVAVKVASLHQLQNLYFALTGEELNIQTCRLHRFQS